MLIMSGNTGIKGLHFDWRTPMPVQKTCEHCRKSFLVPFRRSETVKFCSIECKVGAKTCALICGECGETFERVKSSSSMKYCSRACYHSAAKGVPKNVEQREHYYRTCEVCEVSFRVTFTRKDTARFCSRVCQSNSPAFRKEASEAQRGEKSHAWRGGLYQGKYGYVRVKGQDLSSKEFHFEHRQVMEKAMLEKIPNHPFLIEVDGRKKLDRQIEVHHIDRDRSHNAFSNLLAVTKPAHWQIHHNNKRPEVWECWPYENTTETVF